MFQPNYLQELIRVGEEDAQGRMDELAQLFQTDAATVAAG